MGKREQKKSRAQQMDKRANPSSPNGVPPQSSNLVENSDHDGADKVKERKPCPHIEKGFNSSILTEKLGSSSSFKCEDCRESAADKRGKGKHAKKKGSADSKSDSKAIWVCLECGHFSCGGVGFPTTPQSHALRHTKQTRHPLVIQWEKPQLRWCFKCSSLIPVETIDENGEKKDPFLDIVKLIKTQTQVPEKPPVDVEKVWFGKGSILNEVKAEDTSISSSLEEESCYTVRGMVNLGNTCFFNSVMQNLFAMDKFRDYFYNQDVSDGALSISLKKLFEKTKPQNGRHNVINPRAFFGSICIKAPQFGGYQQQDSHELLRSLLDVLSSEESAVRKQLNASKQDENPSKESPTFVDALFGGRISSTVSCTKCGHSSTVYEPYLDLSLPVPAKKPPKKSKLPPKIGIDTNKEPAQSNAGNEQVTAAIGKETAISFDDFTWMDYLGPETMSDSQDNDASACQYPENIDSNNGILPIASVNPREDEVPLQVTGSELLLLPYKEESFSDEAEFDGLGDLFNEPEVEVSSPPFYGPSLPPGFPAGHNSESEPDEVDNKDSEVSVESCLGHFIKPELLSNDNAWECENCSKHVMANGGESLVSDGEKIGRSSQNCRETECGLTEQDCETTADAIETSLCSSADFKSFDEESSSCPAASSSSVDEPSSSGYATAREQLGDSESSGNCGAEEDGVKDEEITSRKVNVKRDATKRVLIDKAPPILTIHLKRFSQDVRGRLSKLNGHVDFGDILDLRPYMDPRCTDREEYVYRLLGVVEHLGSMRGGHYVAYVQGGNRSIKGETDDKNGGTVWYHASDAYAREISLEEVFRSEAYILFYEKIF